MISQKEKKNWHEKQTKGRLQFYSVHSLFQALDHAFSISRTRLSRSIEQAVLSEHGRSALTVLIER